MTFSYSDKFKFLGIVPRWLWIILFILTILLRVWVLAILLGLGIIIFVILWGVGILAFLEVIDDTGPGHRGNKPGIIAWLLR